MKLHQQQTTDGSADISKHFKHHPVAVLCSRLPRSLTGCGRSLTHLAMRPALQLLICPLTELYVIVFRSFENVTSCERVIWMHTTRKQYWRWVEDFHTDAKRTIRTEQIKLVIIIIIIIIYPLTARVVGAPHMILQPVSSIFPCSPLPSGTWRNPGLSIP